MKKYKLINNQTKEEHLCDKVTIDGFDYYAGNKEPFLNCFIYDVLDKRIWKLTNPHSLNAYLEQNCNNWKMVIATNNPNIDIPKVDDVEIEQLAWEEAKSKFAKEEGREPNINNEKDCFVVGILQEGIIHGYNKSQETHPFTEEDMVDFYEWCDTSEQAAHFWRNNRIFPTMDNSHLSKIKEKRRELLQIWKEQQPKVLFYE